VILDEAGNVYGMTAEGGHQNGDCIVRNGCGVVFQISPNWTEKVIHRFAGPDGNIPQAGLVFDAGKLFGTTYYGGTGPCGYGCGVVFKLAWKARGGWTETVLHSFLGTQPSFPFAPVIFDADGNLYGTTFGNPHGSVFEITP
jgi:uncharacterized repeat protein (TIGR03803 family)